MNRPTPTESQVREREANERQAKEMAREALQAVADESEDPRNHKNWIYATEGALHPLWEFESLGGPKLKQMISRLTLDRRTNETIESVSDINLDRDGQTATDKALRVGGNFLNLRTLENCRPEKSRRSFHLLRHPLQYLRVKPDELGIGQILRGKHSHTNISYYIFPRMTIVPHVNWRKCNVPALVGRTSAEQMKT